MTSSQAKSKQLQSSDPATGDRIVRVDDALRLAAVQCLVSRTGPPAGRHAAERFVEFSQANAIPIDAMWARLGRDDRVQATVLAVPNPGRTAMVFASMPRSVDHTAGHARLIEHACRQLPELGVGLAQVLLEPKQGLQRSAFQHAGFRILAHLSYMERPVPAAAAAGAAVWPRDVSTETHQDQFEPDLLAALEATYEDTLDCPGLRGLRRTTDILAGHRAAGEYDPALWTLLRIAGRPAGVLLLNRSPANNTIELVYIGLAKVARGRGLGTQLLRHGIQLIAGRTERAVTLAVDETNEPAIRMYRREGFRRVLRRTALIRPLEEVNDAT